MQNMSMWTYITENLICQGLREGACFCNFPFESSFQKWLMSLQTSPMICSAEQLIGFYMIQTFFWNQFLNRAILSQWKHEHGMSMVSSDNVPGIVVVFSGSWIQLVHMIYTQGWLFNFFYLFLYLFMYFWNLG